MSLASLTPISPSAEQRVLGGPLVAAPSPIAAGAVAPAFALASAPDRKVALSEFVGQTVILVVYPADWSPVCTDQLALCNELLPSFAEHRAQVLGISVDGVWSHRAFAKDRNLRFPLLSDFEPKGAVSRAYGVYSQQDGASERALFVIDGAGIVRWGYVSPTAQAISTVTPNGLLTRTLTVLS
jgi:peroxiredoxin